MKRLILLLVLLMAVTASSLADESANDTVVQMAQGLLTEVYGYTQEEADAFTYDVTDGGDVWVVRFYGNPAWVYKAGIHKKDMTFASSLSPFTSRYKPTTAESGIRYMLRAIKEGGWFANWNVDSKAAFLEALEWCEIRQNTAMMRGMPSDAYTPAQALNDLFLSCFGDSALWSGEVVEWREAEFAFFGLALEETVSVLPEGITEYVADQTAVYAGSVICEFIGEVPDMLTKAFSHPKLEGWTCIAGAVQTRDTDTDSMSFAGWGLAAFAKGEEQLLVMLVRDAGSKDWELLPVSRTALLPERDLYIVYGGNTARFDIVYPISDTQQESFCCRILNYSSVPSIRVLCGLEEYRYDDLAEGYSLVIGPGTSSAYANWYSVAVTQSGVREETQYPALESGLMEYIDASAFPRTVEACQKAAATVPSMPQGYGISGSVHLRADTSSHSTDLGVYSAGTLVEILDTLPGSAFPWYHVRIGIVEGYMSSNYVTYSEDTMSIPRYCGLSFGILTRDAALKKDTGIFAGTIETLAKGTVVRVLAERGNWLHVSVPLSEDDWLMQPGEVSGFVKSNVVSHGASPLQLEWLAPEDE